MCVCVMHEVPICRAPPAAPAPVTINSDGSTLLHSTRGRGSLQDFQKGIYIYIFIYRLLSHWRFRCCTSTPPPCLIFPLIRSQLCCRDRTVGVRKHHCITAQRCRGSSDEDYNYIQLSVTTSTVFGKGLDHRVSSSVEVLLYVHRNRRFIRGGGPGRPPRLSHTSRALCPAQWCRHGRTWLLGLAGSGCGQSPNIGLGGSGRGQSPNIGLGGSGRGQSPNIGLAGSGRGQSPTTLTGSVLTHLASHACYY